MERAACAAPKVASPIAADSLMAGPLLVVPRAAAVTREATVVRALGYYGFLATHVAPGRLLAVAARRASRVAFNRVVPPLPVARDRLLGALGCDGADMLARLLSRPRPCPVPWDRASLREALGRLAPGEVERALSRAEDAAAGRVRLAGRNFDVARDGGGTDWQLDALHGGRFAAWAPSRALPEAPGLDPKLAWALGRGEQWVALAQGAVLDARRGPAFGAALAASVHDFVAENPVGRGIHWSCTMEAALRAWNLVVALWILSGARLPADPELAVDAARLLVTSGRFVLAHLEDDTPVPNHPLAASWLGLLACAEGLPEWPESPRWRALATEGLSAAVRDQVNEDGTSFEGSLPHQRLALELFSAGALLAHGARRGVGRAYGRGLASLYASTRALLAASGELPQIGDNDAARVLALRERGPTEGGWLLPLGAALLRAPSLLARPGPGDAAEVAWLLGPRAVAWLASARPRRPARSASFPAGGFHVLRRGPFEAFMSCGPNGQRGIGGHSHNDKLSLELFVHGDLAVCDGGSPTTTGDPELRDAFRSTRAHATVVVDGLEQAVLLPDHPFVLPDAAAARLVAFEPGGPADRLVGEHRGFARAGVIHRRELLVCEAGVAVLDRLDGAGAHRVELRWPFASAGARLRDLAPAEAALLDAVARATRLRASVNASRAIEVPLGARRLLVAFAAPRDLLPDVVPSFRSPGYGQLCGATAALVAGLVRCPAALATLFVLLPAPRAG